MTRITTPNPNQAALINNVKEFALRVRFAPIDQPDNIQRESVTVKAGTDITKMYAETGCRVIDIETVTA